MSDGYWEKPLFTCATTVACTAEGKIVPIRCGSWDCDTCARINSLHWAIRIRSGLKTWQREGVTAYFGTLTQPGVSAKFAFKVLPSQWDKFRRLVSRYSSRRGCRFEYAAFAELHESGVPHLHVVHNVQMTRRQWRETARKSGFGYIADCAPARTAGGVAWYVSKYCSKPSSKQGMPKGFRRVRTSQGFPLGKLRVDEDESSCVVWRFEQSYKDWLSEISLRLPQVDLLDVARGVWEMSERLSAERSRLLLERAAVH